MGTDQQGLDVKFTRDVNQGSTNYSTDERKSTVMTRHFSDRLSNYVEAEGFE